MAKSRPSRAQRARRRQEQTGARYASAAAGKAHKHRGPKIPPVDGTLFGRTTPVRMERIGRLVGAVMEECAPCQDSLTRQVLDGDRIAAASLIGLVLGALPAEPGQFSCSTTVEVFHLAGELDDDGVRALVARLEELDRAELADVLSDVLDFVPMFVEALRDASASDSAPEPQPEQGEDPDDGGTAAVTPETTNPIRLSLAAYFPTPGIDLFLPDEQVRELLQMAEASAGGGREALVCWLCDKPIEMTGSPQVNLGLAISSGEGDGAADLLQPVWTHVRCGRPRMWTLVQLNAARRERGLPTWGADPTPATTPEAREPDWFTSSLLNKSGTAYPLLVIQPGLSNRWGTPGHLTDMISMGLRPVDLQRGRVEEVPSWTIRMDRGRVAEITRQGAGKWWVADATTGTVDGQWRTVGKARRQAVVVVLPPRWLTDPHADPTARMLEACAQEFAYGGMMQLTGTFS